MSQKSLRALQQKWYRKLKLSGFEDIESVGYLQKSDLSKISQHYTESSFEEKRRYYELASQLVYEPIFPDALTKKIWTLHSDGRTASEIAKLCGFRKCKRRRVEKVINHYAALIKRTT